MFVWKNGKGVFFMIALDLAKYVVTKCRKDGYDIDNLRLNMLLYLIQERFAKRGETAFFDLMEARAVGPIVPSVYNFFGSRFGCIDITASYPDVWPLEPEDKELIDEVVDSNRDVHIWDLVEKACRPGGAWARIFHGDGKGIQPIPSGFLCRCIEDELWGSDILGGAPSSEPSI